MRVQPMNREDHDAPRLRLDAEIMLGNVVSPPTSTSLRYRMTTRKRSSCHQRATVDVLYVEPVAFVVALELKTGVLQWLRVTSQASYWLT